MPHINVLTLQAKSRGFTGLESDGFSFFYFKENRPSLITSHGIFKKYDEYRASGIQHRDKKFLRKMSQFFHFFHPLGVLLFKTFFRVYSKFIVVFFCLL